MLESMLEVLLPCAVPAVPPKERCEEEPVLARPKAPPCPADPERARSAATGSSSEVRTRVWRKAGNLAVGMCASRGDTVPSRRCRNPGYQC